MHTLHRHIFLSVLLTCAAAVGLLALVLLTGNALKELLGPALAGQLPLASLLRLVGLLLPYALVYALPLGMLTGVLLVLGRMSAQHEITAARAAGLGLGYVARPVLLLGALGTVLALVINYEWMPRTRASYLAEMATTLRQNPLSLIEPRTFVTRVPNVVFYVQEKDGPTLREVWIWRLDAKKRVTEFVHGRRGLVEYDGDRNSLRLTLYDVVVDRRNPDEPETFSNSDYQATSPEVPYPEELALDKIFGRPTIARPKPAFRTLGELLQDRARLAANAASPTDAAATQARATELMRVDVALTEKGAGALAVLVFALAGVPLGVRVSRRESSANLVVAVAFFLGFYLLNEILHWLENYPKLRPDLLLWLPPLLFLALGAWLFRRAGRV